MNMLYVSEISDSSIGQIMVIYWCIKSQTVLLLWEESVLQSKLNDFAYYPSTLRLIFQKIYQKWSQFLFIGCNFFCVKNREKFSTHKNMVFPQILSRTPLLSHQWLPKYVNYPLRHQLRWYFGG